MPAQIFATPTGWVMKSSPGLAALVGVVLAGEHERLEHARRGRRLGDLVGVLLDDREQVREQLALERA